MITYREFDVSEMVDVIAIYEKFGFVKMNDEMELPEH